MIDINYYTHCNKRDSVNLTQSRYQLCSWFFQEVKFVQPEYDQYDKGKRLEEGLGKVILLLNPNKSYSRRN